MAASAQRILTTVTPGDPGWDDARRAADHSYLNLTGTRADPDRFWNAPVHDRLGRIKAAVDPDNRIRANHPVASTDQPGGDGR
jgi:hypothetical protein